MLNGDEVKAAAKEVMRSVVEGIEKDEERRLMKARSLRDVVDTFNVEFNCDLRNNVERRLKALAKALVDISGKAARP
jgi:hypothetical protein